MLIKIGNQWQQWTLEDEGFLMMCISFHIYVWIYSGSSRCKQAMATWTRKKKEQRLKMNITNRDFHGHGYLLIADNAVSSSYDEFVLEKWTSTEVFPRAIISSKPYRYHPRKGTKGPSLTILLFGYHNSCGWNVQCNVPSASRICICGKYDIWAWRIRSKKSQIILLDRLITLGVDTETCTGPSNLFMLIQP